MLRENSKKLSILLHGMNYVDFKNKHEVTFLKNTYLINKWKMDWKDTQ